MSDSREESPDWLRSFKPPTLPPVEFSSGSELPSENSQSSDDEDGIRLSQLFKRETKHELGADDEDEVKESAVIEPIKHKLQTKIEKVKGTPKRKREDEDDSERKGKTAKIKDANDKSASKKNVKSHNQLIWALSSDSESSHDTILVRKDKDNIDGMLLNPKGKQHTKQASKLNSPTKQMKEEGCETSEKVMHSTGDGENDTKKSVMKDESTGKLVGPQGSSSRLPLLLSEKVQRSKALVECDGESIDLSGDVGSVGRVVISDDPSKNHEMMLDLKGTIYRTTIVPSRTFCVVSFGQSEAKIEAIMNDYIQLKPLSNVYEAETMVEGTLDGFSFNSEDEADKPTAQADKQEVTEEQPDSKTKRKTDKVMSRKKGKSAVVKPPKKVKKKAKVTSKSKTKK